MPLYKRKKHFSTRDRGSAQEENNMSQRLKQTIMHTKADRVNDGNAVRIQGVRVRTGAYKRKIPVILCAVVLAALAFGTYRAVNPPYAPPPFEPEAVAGIPSPGADMGYGKVGAEGGFSFWVAGVMYQQQDGSLELWFTNPAGSEVNLMCEIQTEDGTVVYKSGVLRPGEYVERLQPLARLAGEAVPIEMKVYAFEENTWYSKGTISLMNTLQPY